MKTDQWVYIVAVSDPQLWSQGEDGRWDDSVWSTEEGANKRAEEMRTEIAKEAMSLELEEEQWAEVMVLPFKVQGLI